MRCNYISALMTLVLILLMPQWAAAEETFFYLVKLKSDPSVFSLANTRTDNMRSEEALSAGVLRKKDVNRFTQSYHITPKAVFGQVLFGFYAELTEEQINKLENDPLVEGLVKEDLILYFDRKRDEHLPFLEFPQVPFRKFFNGGIGKSDRFKGKGIHAYVFDSGIDHLHKDIVANLGEGFASEPCNHSRLCPVPYADRDGHGTHVAGLIAAPDNAIDIKGVAPESTVHPVKVCDDGGACSSIAIFQGFEWAVTDMLKRKQPAIGNVSLGGVSTAPSGKCLETGYEGDDPMAEVFCNAALQGMVIVTSAGNSGADAAFFSPAKFDSVITVSAFESNEFSDDAIYYPAFSNYGTGLNPWTQKNSGVVTISAPGVDIRSLNRTHGDILFSGTSMSSPLVAGAAALILEAIPQKMDLTALTNVRKILAENAFTYQISIKTDFSDIRHEEGSLNIGFLDQLP